MQDSTASTPGMARTPPKSTVRTNPLAVGDWTGYAYAAAVSACCS